jgi:glutamate-1-semialdehyde aminotransferase
MKKIRNARIMAMIDALHETKTENQKMQQLQESNDELQEELIALTDDAKQKERIIEIFEEVYNNVCKEFAEEIENAYRIGMSDGIALHKIAV